MLGNVLRNIVSSDPEGIKENGIKVSAGEVLSKWSELAAEYVMNGRSALKMYIDIEWKEGGVFGMGGTKHCYKGTYRLESVMKSGKYVLLNVYSHDPDEAFTIKLLPEHEVYLSSGNMKHLRGIFGL
ncbi:hypothetical protein [Thermococcus sp. JdF3]|uniref:hypothetical protein n=1 Tax=Thermococcus sp. JdF3 TaxID=1638258 RepID=UPI00143883EE|nr:hypothetical protein [Thermococcus sp. JdF3]NJE00818.1 hypothetical protein [Thermococcus sp. JdF3]